MEVSKIKSFLKIKKYNGNGNGDGNGYGDGNGNGNGNGDGNGDGNGYGNGYGDGYGDGDGYGNGYGVLKINKMNVFLIDNVQTIITSIKNNVALGFILNIDLTIQKCVIVKNDYYFAHGKNLKVALKSLEEKTANNMPISERIKMFKSKFKNFNLKYKASLFYDWHFKLTGSCKTGRENFCKNNNINLKKDKISVNEFIELTKNSYGSEIILKLKECQIK